MRNVLTGLVMTLASGAAAQEVANNASFGDWVVNCEAVSTQRTSCWVAQTQSRADNGGLVLQLIAYALPEGGALLAAQVPIGAYLPFNVSFQPEADENPQPQRMIWQRCLGQICEAALQFSAEELAALNDAEQVLFGYQPAPGVDALVTRVSTGTLVEALDAIRTE